MEKICFKCDRLKPLTQFYRHPEMGDGHLNKCKECTKADVRKNRKRSVDYYRWYDAVRNRTTKRRATLRKKINAKQKRAHQKKWSQKNQHKRRAHRLVQRAIASGLLSKKPCEVCGVFPAEAHHDDYTKPLDVRWLCRVHHAEHHMPPPPKEPPPKRTRE